VACGRSQSPSQTSESSIEKAARMYETLVKPKKRVAQPDMRNRADSNSKLKLTVGKRFMDARELNGFGQTQAALMMGWKNATQLSLIEQGKRMPPHQVLIIASTVFGTSIDFLLGLSNEPERDPKKAERDAAMRHVHSMIEANAKSMTGMLLQYLSNGTPAVSSARRLMACSTYLVDTVSRVRELNPKAFDEKLKGGARLIGAVRDMDEAMHEVRMMLDKHDRFTEFSFKEAEAAAHVTRPLFEQIADLPGVDMDAVHRGRK
jgi:transcriptional regulator with XRE-family HTH domain